MKAYRYLFYFLFSFLFACKSTVNINQILEGSWGVYQLEYGNDAQSLINEKNEKFIFSAPLYLGINDGFITLKLDNDNEIQGRIKANLKRELKFIEFYDCTDTRFNGNYQIWLDTLETNDFRTKYKLLLESDSTFIVGTKTIIRKF